MRNEAAPHHKFHEGEHRVNLGLTTGKSSTNNRLDHNGSEVELCSKSVANVLGQTHLLESGLEKWIVERCFRVTNDRSSKPTPDMHTSPASFRLVADSHKMLSLNWNSLYHQMRTITLSCLVSRMASS
jgi:hypothetical protein